MMISLDVLETLKKKGKISEKTFTELKKIYDLKSPQKMAMGGIAGPAAMFGVGEEAVDPNYVETYQEKPKEKSPQTILEEGKAQAMKPDVMALEPVQKAPSIDQAQMQVAPQLDMYAKEASNIMENTAKSIGYAKAVDTAIQTEQEKMALLNQEKEKMISDTMGKFDARINEYNNMKVDPNRFWANKTTGDKIAIGIGLALAGANGSSAGVQILNQAIDRDIQSQLAAIESKKEQAGMARTYMQDMMNVFKDKAAAIEASKIAGLTSAEAKLKEYQVRAQGALQKAELQKMSMEIGAQKMAAQARLTQAIQNSGPARDNADMINRISQIEDQALRKQAMDEFQILNKLKAADETVKDVYKDTKASFAWWKFPMTEESARVATSEAKLFPIIKSIIGEKMTDADAKRLIEPWIPSKTDSGSQIAEKEKQLINWLSRQRDQNTVTLQSLGIAPKQRFTEKAPIKGK